MRNRRGSFTVAIVLIFSAMLIMTGAVLSAAGNMAVFSTAEDFGRLWGTSILAEYDLNLKDRYGLFGFLGDEVTVEKKLDSLTEKHWEVLPLHVEFQGAHVIAAE